MNATDSRTCPTCGAALPAREDRCPACLLSFGLAAGAGAGADGAADASVDLGAKNLMDAFAFAPRVFGPYELLEEIARGGMGVVYKARQPSLDRVVALKMILAGHFASPEAVRRFRAEAEAAARLRHSHIVAIHDVGEHDGQPYFTMDYIEGSNLSQAVRQQPFPPRQAAGIVRTVAEAIQFAHDHGVLHRDLKPSNILLDPEGRPHVTDFGLAKRMQSAEWGVESAETGPSSLITLHSELTLSGEVLGSPNFISPEQASGRRGAVGPGTDVYSLGAVLCYLVTGRAPFVGDSVADVLRRVMETDPLSPRLLNPAVPRDLETIALKCLEKEPARRYATARELAEELGRFLGNEPIRARPIGAAGRAWRWCRRKPALAGLSAAFALAVVLGFAGVLAQKAKVQRNLVRQYVANGTRLMNDGDLFGALLWYTEALKLDRGSKTREEPHRIRIASVLENAPRLTHVFTHGAVLHDAQFSPDGRFVITASDDHTARVWDLETGQERLVLRHDSDVLSAVYSRDGKWITTASRDKSGRVWNAETGAPASPPLRHADEVRQTVLSPDGKLAATCSADRTVQLWNATTWERLRTLPHSNALHRILFSSDGRLLGVVTRLGAYLVWDVATGELRLNRGQSSYVAGFDFSPDSTAAVTCEGNDVRIWDTRTGRERTNGLLRADGNALSASFSPDGNFILVGNEHGMPQVWDAATGSALFSPMEGGGRGAVWNARFSPDGRLYVTASESGMVQAFYSESGRKAGPPFRHLLPVWDAAFHPDSRRLLTLSVDQRACVWDPVMTRQPPFSRWERLDDQHRTLSVDGKRLLLWGPNNTVVMREVESRATLAVFPHANEVAYSSFSPDGRTILTACRDGRGWPANHNDSFLWDAETGRCLSGTNMLGSLRVQYAAFSSNGQRLLTCGYDSNARVWDARTGKPVTPHLLHAQRVHWGSFDPSGRRVVTASADKMVRVWDAATGEPLSPPLPHQSSVLTVRWSQDGRRLECLQHNTRVQVWDWIGGEPLTMPRRPEVQESPDVHLPLRVAHPESRPVEELTVLAQLLTASRLDDRGSVVPLELSELAGAWPRVRRHFPDWSRVSPAVVAHWHLERAELCCKAGQRTETLAHLKAALCLKKEDPKLTAYYEAVARSLPGQERVAFRNEVERQGIPPRDPAAPPNLIDLTRHYTSALHHHWGNDRSQVPAGLQAMGGTLFDIRGSLELKGVSVAWHGDRYPTRVDGIRVGLKCRRLHFLQATEYECDDGIQVATYVLHYADGHTRELPVLHGRDIRTEWNRPCLPKNPGDAEIVWAGTNPSAFEGSGEVFLYKSTRENPRPDVEITHIDFVSSMAFPAPFLVALTVE